MNGLQALAGLALVVSVLDLALATIYGAERLLLLRLLALAGLCALACSVAYG